MQQAAFIACPSGGFTDSSAANYFFYQVAFLVDVNLSFVGRAKQIVIIAHDFLVSPNQHEGQIIRFVRLDLVQLQDLLDVMQVDELIDYSV